MSLSFFSLRYLLFSLEWRTENGEPPSPTVKHAVTGKASILSNSNSPSPLSASISHLWFFICLNLSTNPKRVIVSVSLILHQWRYICWNWNWRNLIFVTLWHVKMKTKKKVLWLFCWMVYVRGSSSNYSKLAYIPFNIYSIEIVNVYWLKLKLNKLLFFVIMLLNRLCTTVLLVSTLYFVDAIVFLLLLKWSYSSSKMTG
jgi:hypothetical protein